LGNDANFSKVFELISYCMYKLLNKVSNLVGNYSPMGDQIICIRGIKEKKLQLIDRNGAVINSFENEEVYGFRYYDGHVIFSDVTGSRTFYSDSRLKNIVPLKYVLHLTGSVRNNLFACFGTYKGQDSHLIIDLSTAEILFSFKQESILNAIRDFNEMYIISYKGATLLVTI
jgi:hypothetical protein